MLRGIIITEKMMVMVEFIARTVVIGIWIHAGMKALIAMSVARRSLQIENTFVAKVARRQYITAKILDGVINAPCAKNAKARNASAQMIHICRAVTMLIEERQMNSNKRSTSQRKSWKRWCEVKTIKVRSMVRIEHFVSEIGQLYYRERI